MYQEAVRWWRNDGSSGLDESMMQIMMFIVASDANMLMGSGCIAWSPSCPMKILQLELSRAIQGLLRIRKEPVSLAKRMALALERERDLLDELGKILVKVWQRMGIVIAMENRQITDVAGGQGLLSLGETVEDEELLLGGSEHTGENWKLGKCRNGKLQSESENSQNGACSRNVMALGSESATPRGGMTEGRVHREEIGTPVTERG
jgi:hypothetical protein